MKGNDKKIFYGLLITSLMFGYVMFDKNFQQYTELMIFISMMMGFKIISLSALLNSPLKRALYDRKIKLYETELHRLKSLYKHSLFFEGLCVFVLFMPIENEFYMFGLLVGKYIVVLPILVGALFCFYKVTTDLLQIFVYPTTR